MMAIWSKGDDHTDRLVHAFTVGDDWLYDRHLAPYDLLGCIAHAQMLGETGIIPSDDAQALVRHLRVLWQEFSRGEWTVEASDEDVHSRIEALLIERLGAAGQRLHTGRSRNDQVLTASRLWLKDHLISIAQASLAAAEVLQERARCYEFVPLPGYTHLQRGMPSSLGMFFAAHAAALVEDLILLDASWHFADACPLGSGASYGVGLPLDRQRCADLLGFGRAGGIALCDANSRGKVELAALDACSAILGDLSRLAADVIFFVSSEAGFLSLGQGLTTGSSIMPQKRNPDLFELLRGRTARFLGLRTGLAAITIGLHSGYSRDLQDSKPLLIDGLRLTEQALAVVQRSVPGIEPVIERIHAALTPDLYATDEAYRLVREEGMPFREAYVQVGRNLQALQVPEDHEAVLRSRSHAGSTGNLGLPSLAAESARLAAVWQQRKQDLHQHWQKLLDTADLASAPGLPGFCLSSEHQKGM